MKPFSAVFSPLYAPLYAAFFAALVSFIVIEVIYLAIIQKMFLRQIRAVQRGAPFSVNMGGALAIYAVIFFILYYFVWRLRRPAWEAAILGGAIYAFYETTNMALLNGWTWNTVLIDTIYGAFVFYATTAVFNYYAP
jgi:uncharacterized membrane protein